MKMPDFAEKRKMSFGCKAKITLISSLVGAITLFGIVNARAFDCDRAEEFVHRLFDQSHWTKVRFTYEKAKAPLLVDGKNPYAVHFHKYGEHSPELPWTKQTLFDAQVPSRLWKHYDLEKGELLIQRLKAHFLSSENGREKLRAVRIAIADVPWNIHILRDYARAMEQLPELRLYVSATGKRKALVEHQVANLPKQVRQRITVYDDKVYKDTKIWTQDGSKPEIGAQDRSLISDTQPRAEYRQTADAANEAHLVEADHTNAFFEGGNVIVGDQHVFTGSSTVEANMNLFLLSRPNARAFLAKEWGKPVVEIGVSHVQDAAKKALQPDFHIDLTFAVAYDAKKRKEIILLGSFEELLDQVAAHPMGELKKRNRAIAEWIEDPQVLAQQARRELQVQALEEKFKGLGYEVRRVPSMDVSGKPVLNYTNVIFSDGHVIMPENGFQLIDDSMKAFYRELGYEPIPMPVVQESSRCKGGIRCLSETFRRPIMRMPRTD